MSCRAFWVTVLAVGLLGCGHESIPHWPDATGTETTPAVLLAERVESPEGRNIYVSLLPGVPSSAADRARAYEFNSVDIWIFDGAVYIRDRDANTMARYRVTNALELVPDTLQDGKEARFSFQTLGLAPFGFDVIFISPSRAYLFDYPESRVVVWNPTEMSLSGTFPMGDAWLKAGFDPQDTYPVSPILVDGHVFMAIYVWQDYEAVKVFPGAGVIMFDANSDAPATLLEDDRMTGALRVYPDAAGDLYVFGDQYSGMYNLVGAQAGAIPPAGVQRIRRGELAFDPTYFVDLLALTASPAIYSTNKVDDDHFLLQAWQPGENPGVLPTPDDYWNAQEFVYLDLNLAERSSAPVASIPKAGAGSSAEFHVDGKLYVQFYREAGADVHVVTADGDQPAFEIPGGDLWTLERVR